MSGRLGRSGLSPVSAGGHLSSVFANDVPTRCCSCPVLTQLPTEMHVTANVMKLMDDNPASILYVFTLKSVEHLLVKQTDN